MTVAPGDQAFMSRQDLISYVRANPGQVSTLALQYLGTFSRELNAPSVSPPGYPTGQDPSLINQRVTQPFARASDATTANAGEPLIKYRFPLSRLSWIEHSGPREDRAARIYKYFGLTWSSSIVDRWSGEHTSGWVYNHGSSNAILSLAEVADRGREPDFFELLQAGIRRGSLGRGAGDSASLTMALDEWASGQIIQIGANLVDQYDADSYPTHISFSGVDFYGVENLPYLVQVYNTPYRFHGSSQPANRPNTGVWYQPEVWNPHAKPAAAPSAPMQFRFIVAGAAFASLNYLIDGGKTSAINHFSPDGYNANHIAFSTAGNQFDSPTLLSPLVSASAVGSNNHVTDDGLCDFLGIWVGTANVPDVRVDPSAPDIAVFAQALPSPTVNFLLQYYDGATWLTYDAMRNVKVGVKSFDASIDAFQTYAPSAFLIRPDPRTDRFGPSFALDHPSYLSNETIRPDAGSGFMVKGDFVAPGWQNPAMVPGTLSDNRDTSVTYYEDPDGVVRPGDGAYTDGNLFNGGYPLATDSFNRASSRPIVLNRPFRSVADMGYASRGAPWKHLDFFTAESADAALLDLFCVYEPALPPSPGLPANPLPIEAGRLDLNTRQLPVIQAALAGAIISDSDGTVISAADAATLASILTGITTSPIRGPLLTKGDLVTQVAPHFVYASPSDTIIKRRREAAIRALSDIGNTRTWNLLIDVIVQSGRYAPSAANLNQFTVEGQRRYWLHVAIDRYTGETLQQQLEPVYE